MGYDSRVKNQIRNLNFTRDFTKHAEGSVLVEAGDTKVICNATVEEGVPNFLEGTERGWLTAEYSMLPRATGTRNIREISKGKADGRSMEIQRLIGRSLRSIVDLSAIGERTIIIDCDVIQADGGTRTAGICGGFVALVDAFTFLYRKELIQEIPVKDFLAAVSVAKVAEEIILDPDFWEDSSAQIDLNVVMTGSREIVEIQGTAEGNPFTKKELIEFMEYAEKGIMDIINKQKKALGVTADQIEKSKYFNNNGKEVY